VSEKTLTYRASSEELAIFDRYNIKWSDFCRENIKRLKHKDRDMYYDKLIVRMVLIALGCSIFATSTLYNNFLIILLEWVIGITMVFIGSLSTILLIYKIKKLEKEKYGQRVL